MESTPSRELQIPKQLDDLQNALETLEKSLDSLSSRLSKASTPLDPQVEGNMKEPVLSCEYAENLAVKSRMVRRLRDMVVSLEQRLEI